VEMGWRCGKASCDNMDGGKMKQGRAGQNGFTLVEVLVALVVLISGMLGVMGMQYMSVQGNATSRNMRVATNLGQMQMEMLQATPFNNLAQGNDSPVLDNSTSGGVVFQRIWWVQPNCSVLALGINDANDNPADPCNPALLGTDICVVDPDPAAAAPVSAIRVRTCWTDRFGNAHSVTFNDAKNNL